MDDIAILWNTLTLRETHGDSRRHSKSLGDFGRHRNTLEDTESHKDTRRLCQTQEGPRKLGETLGDLGRLRMCQRNPS